MPDVDVKNCRERACVERKARAIEEMTELPGRLRNRNRAALVVAIEAVDTGQALESLRPLRQPMATGAETALWLSRPRSAHAAAAGDDPAAAR